MAILAPAQQGGLGGGGFGGGGFGGWSIASTGSEVLRTHILTPGDRGEWEVDAVAGETIIANVQSSVFDPALEVVNAAGEVLASNDDIRLGDQSARLLYRFAKAGKYRVWVKGYKSAAGGQYDISMRRFVPTDAQYAKRLATSVDETGVNWFRITAKKDEPVVISPTSTTFEPKVTIFSPTGERLQQDQTMTLGDEYLLRPTLDGDYYVLIEAKGNAKAGLNMLVTAARRFETTTEVTTDHQKLDAGGVDLWRFDAEPGDILRIERICNGPRIGLDFGDTFDATKQETGQTTTYAFLQMSHKGSGEFVVLVLKKGKFELTVHEPTGLATDYKLRLSKTGKPVPASGAATAEIGVGKNDFWVVPGKSGKVLQIASASTSFDSDLTVYDPKGKEVAENDDANGTDSALTLSMPEEGNYIVVVGSRGGGGGGKYSLKTEEIKAKTLKLGGTETGTVSASKVEIWSFPGKEGQSILASAQGSSASLHVTIFGPNGVVLATSQEQGGVGGLSALKLPSDGTYTIWIRSRQGSSDYKLKCIDLDS